MNHTADQEFLASFAVEIDESGVSRLQTVLEENRKLAEELAAAFSAASEAIHTLTEDLGTLPGFSGGIAEEGFSGLGGIALGLDLTEAKKDLSAFMDQLKKPVGWPLGKQVSVTWKGQNLEGLVTERSVDADTMEGNWQSEIMIEVKP